MCSPSVHRCAARLAIHANLVPASSGFRCPCCPQSACCQALLRMLQIFHELFALFLSCFLPSFLSCGGCPLPPAKQLLRVNLLALACKLRDNRSSDMLQRGLTHAVILSFSGLSGCQPDMLGSNSLPSRTTLCSIKTPLFTTNFMRSVQSPFSKRAVGLLRIQTEQPPTNNPKA